MFNNNKTGYIADMFIEFATASKLVIPAFKTGRQNWSRAVKSLKKRTKSRSSGNDLPNRAIGDHDDLSYRSKSQLH